MSVLIRVIGIIIVGIRVVCRLLRNRYIIRNISIMVLIRVCIIF